MSTTESSQSYNNEYTNGCLVVADEPTHLTPKMFKVIKVDEDFGVVSYLRTDMKIDTIGFSYIRKPTLWERIKYMIL